MLEIKLAYFFQYEKTLNDENYVWRFLGLLWTS